MIGYSRNKLCSKFLRLFCTRLVSAPPHAPRIPPPCHPPAAAAMGKQESKLKMKFVDWFEKCYSETVKFLMSDETHEIKAVAAPGLITLADVALYRANEGQLTATVCATNDLLNCVLDLKRTAKLLLRELREFYGMNIVGGSSSSSSHRSLTKYVELGGSFSREAVDFANSVLERITTDRLALSANLGSNESGSSSSSNNVLPSFATSSATPTPSTVQEDLDAATLHTMITGRRKKLNPSDCWESSRLFCPDYVWADDVLSFCQRGMKSLLRHQFCCCCFSNMSEEESQRMKLLPYSCRKHAKRLAQLIRKDIPDMLSIFKIAMESNATVSRRLYIVKCEYRAPFRAFLESHNKLRSAPSASIVDQYIRLNVENKQQEVKSKRLRAKQRIDELLRLPHFVETVKLEQKCEMVEMDMMQMILPFAELACVIDGKKVTIHPTLSVEEFVALEECLRRLRPLVVTHSYGLPGIRSLLLDWQGIPRDDNLFQAETKNFPFGSYRGAKNEEEEAFILRVQKFVSILRILVDLATVKGGYKIVDKNDSDTLKALLKKCSSSLDMELLVAQCRDWFSYMKAQHALLESKALGCIANEMRQTEIELGIAVASKPALDMVRKRLVSLDSERKMRLELLRDVMNDVSLREFGISIKVSDINKDEMLQLPETSASGVFDRKLLMEGEPLPLG